MSKPRVRRTNASVGAAIADARLRAGFSQAQLARRLNRPQSYVSKIETGVRDVGVREFVWIVQRIGENSLQLLEQLCRDDDFEDLDRRVKRGRF
ncbi:MAG TPA: helix-turn-helix transcriptional regulator [Steroidobacter sp.]|uniref:helix-turn-helix domain-containing protein n=1 Tax=Steroidobacter sp. TaxID=1978227 RepID=UPI002EDB22F4